MMLIMSVEILSETVGVIFLCHSVTQTLVRANATKSTMEDKRAPVTIFASHSCATTERL